MESELLDRHEMLSVLTIPQVFFIPREMGTRRISQDRYKTSNDCRGHFSTLDKRSERNIFTWIRPKDGLAAFGCSADENRVLSGSQSRMRMNMLRRQSQFDMQELNFQQHENGP